MDRPKFIHSDLKPTRAIQAEFQAESSLSCVACVLQILAITILRILESETQIVTFHSLGFLFLCVVVRYIATVFAELALKMYI